jgi:ubiquinone/menaquinone biosynthesis C-methylase UbiE
MSSPAELYESFYGPAMFRPLAAATVAFAAPKPGERALDVACGTGLVARHLAPLVGDGGRVVALDLNPAMLAVGRAQPAPPGAPIEWLEGDAVTLEPLYPPFNLAICQQGLQFFSDRIGALRRLRATLEPGGRLVLALWQGIEAHPLFAEFTHVEARHLGPLGVTYEELIAPFSLGDPAAIRALLEEADFADIELSNVTVEARFPNPATFARKMETAYGAVIPQFVANPQAFEEFVAAVERETRDIVARYADEDTVRFPMPAHLVRAVPA